MIRTTLLASAALIAVTGTAHAADFIAGDLLVSKSTYSVPANSAAGQLTVGKNLPYGGVATGNGTYPQVFNNNTVDGSFGVTTAIAIDQVNLATKSVVGTIAIDPSVAVTSFSSKSELGLNLSTNGQSVTFSGYQAPVGALDVSNSNTSAVYDASNPVTATNNRVVVQIDGNGAISSTVDTAYSGNNQRNVILNNGNNTYIAAGNAGNGGNGAATLAAIGANTGVQLIKPGSAILPNPAYTGSSPDVNNSPTLGNSTQAGSFNITQLGYAADKSSKDNNFRGETIFNNTLYVTKGSGGNGINTVYQVGAAGGVNNLNASSPITILPGFNTLLAKSGAGANYTPFGLFFANANTLYVTDEGTGGSKGGPDANPGGLQKWSFDGTKWNLAYTLTSGLNLNSAYTVAGLAASLDPYTDGLRNLTGRVNADGTVTLIAVTSTVSTSGDQGADPNEVVTINDILAATSLPSTEAFSVVKAPTYGVVYRGVSFTPTPEPGALALLSAGLATVGLIRRRR